MVSSLQRSAFLTVAVLCLCLTQVATAAGQDVVRAGEPAGVSPPAWVLEILRTDPEARYWMGDGQFRPFSTNDARQVFWWALGYRDPSEQRFLDQADVDDDDVVVARDGLMILSFLSGLSVPGDRLGRPRR